MDPEGCRKHESKQTCPDQSAKETLKYCICTELDVTDNAFFDVSKNGYSKKKKNDEIQ